MPQRGLARREPEPPLLREGIDFHDQAVDGEGELGHQLVAEAREVGDDLSIEAQRS